MLTGILFVCPAGISEQYEVEEKWRKVKKTSRGVSASHVSLISVKLSALERSPSGALDDGNAQATAYGNTSSHPESNLINKLVD